MMLKKLTIEPFGENGWLARLSGDDMVATALFVNAVAEGLRDKLGIIDSVAGVDSLVLRFDPGKVSPEGARNLLNDDLSAVSVTGRPVSERMTIPVCYGGAHGPDFDNLCTQLGVSPDSLIELHSAQIYRVLTIGFAPGFAYLGPLPEALQTRRLKTPRARVPAGSVGVAGAMTGIYPLASPGGWALIGRTPKRLFNPHAPTPFVFTPGAEVVFTPIDEREFIALDAKAP